MAFVSIGQKYGFVSVGDVRRKMVADAREEERAKADAEKRERAQLMLADGFTREQASKYSGVPLDEL